MALRPQLSGRYRYCYVCRGAATLFGDWRYADFQRENSDIDDKFMPKFNYIAKRIMFVYISLMLGCIFSLHWAGMPWFDAVNHGLSIVATCGLSIKNSSLGFYDSLTIEMLAALFFDFKLSADDFLYYDYQNQDMHSFRTQQVVTFLKVLAVYILATSCWLVFKGVYGFGRCFALCFL